MDDSRNSLLGLLGEARQELVSLARSLSASDLARPTENEGWTVKDTFSHVAGSEAGLLALAKRFAGGESQPAAGPDLHTRNKRQVEMRRDATIEELLGELDASRAEVLQAIAQLTEEQMFATGQLASGASINVRGLLERIAQHEREHCQHVRSALGNG